MRRTFIFALMVSCLLSSPAGFACRLEGMMGLKNPSDANIKEEEQFLHTVLLSDPNSLQQESAKRPPKDGVHENLDLEDLSGILRKYGSPDGWGIASYACPTTSLQIPKVIRGVAPAYQDNHFKQAVIQPEHAHTSIFLAHVRLASLTAKEVELQNVHPFTFKNWSFMHNGEVSGAFSPVVTNKIAQFKEQLAGGPKGATDSERVFYFFLANLYETTGTLDSQHVPLETLQKVFSRTITTLIENSTPTAKVIPKNVLGVEGHLQMQPACNFVLTDGEHVFAYRKVLNLYLAQKTLSTKQKVYLIASEQTQKQDASVQWLLLPENHLLTLYWDENGNPRPRLEPVMPFTH